MMESVEKLIKILIAVFIFLDCLLYRWNGIPAV